MINRQQLLISHPLFLRNLNSMNIELFAPVKFLNIKEDIHTQDFHVFKNHDKIEELFSSKQRKEQLGLLRINELKNLCYFHSSIKKEPVFSKPNEWDKFLIKKSGLISEFVSFLWFVKDNSVSVRTLLAFMVSNPLWVNDYRVNHSDNSNCHGEFVNVAFSRAELIEAEKVFQKYSAISSLNLKLNDALEKHYNRQNKIPMIESIEYNWQERIDRAILFLGMVRTHAFLPFKITFYVPMLEALFSTSPMEVTHQVSQRVAYYIGGSKSIVKENYDIVKEAYNFRNKLFHGAELTSNKEYQKQRILSTKLDSLSRVVLTKVIMKDSEIFSKEKKSAFENWAHLLSFGIK